LQQETGAWPDSGLGAIPVLASNAVGHEDSVAVVSMCSGITIPLLQDTGTARLWEKARAQKDDVFILDARRNVARVFSCAVRPLTTPANRDTLRAWVRGVAG
jgi:hypothetical protein